MGLFKEFKDDFSQAVNELVPGDVPEKEVEPKAQTADNLVVDRKSTRLNSSHPSSSRMPSSA